MNEQPNTTVQLEKTLDDKKKNALLRYLGIMFAVAFLFVLLSLVGELRSNKAAITELNQSSTSAIAKAEQLQDTNRQLETDNAYLTGRIEELEKQLEELEDELALQTAENKLLQEENTQLDQQAVDARQETADLVSAYENLLEADSLRQAGEDNASILAQLKENVKYYAENALKLYENLTKEGE